MKQTLIYGIIALMVVMVVVLFAFFFTGSEGSGEGAGENGGGFFGSLFPFTFNGGGEDRPLIEGGYAVTGEDTRPIPRLRQISDKPVSGMFAYTGEDNDTYIRFIERETGNVYETKGSSFETKRITNTTIPGIQEVLWINKNEFIIRYLSDEVIENFYITLADVEGEQSVNGEFLSPFTRGSLNKTGELLALEETAPGGVLSVSKDGGTERVLFSSPLASWVPLNTSAGVFVASAPASGVLGFLYRVSGGSLIKQFEAPGLMALMSPEGTHALISSGGSTVALGALNLETREFTVAPLETLASKCAWVGENPPQVVCGIPENFPPAAYPNDWLLGRVQFSDSLWGLSLNDGSGQVLAILAEEAATPIDVFRPVVSENGEYLLFINKRDLSLWSYRIADVAPVVSTPQETPVE